MIINTLFPLSLLFFFLFGCISEKEQDALSEVASMINAGSSKIAHAKLLDTNKGNLNVIKLEFSEFNDNKEIASERVASIAALLYLKKLPANKYKDFDKIEITLNRYSSTLVKAYNVNEALNAESFFKPVVDFFESFKDNSPNKVRNVTDNQHIPDTALTDIVSTIRQINSTYGNISDIMFVGFEYNTIKDTGEPIMIAWAEVKNGDFYTDYKFHIKLENNKIIYIEVNG